MTAAEFKQIRLDASLTQSQLAKILGTTERTIRRYETDEQPIPRVAQVAIGIVKTHPELVKSWLK